MNQALAGRTEFATQPEGFDLLDIRPGATGSSGSDAGQECTGYAPCMRLLGHS